MNEKAKARLKFNKIKFVIRHYSAFRHLAHYPLWTIRLTLCRLAFTLFRRFVGETLISPKTGEKIYNVQSLVNYWNMHITCDFGTAWEKLVRETAAPVVIDIGSNIGQFGHYVRSLNPGVRVISVDAWQEMNEYAKQSEHHFCTALGKNEGKIVLTIKSGAGLTASTSNTWNEEVREQRLVPQERLANIAELKHIDVLKIDVDGAELEVLEGGEDVLNRVHCVIIECLDKGTIDKVKHMFSSSFKWRCYNNLDWVGIENKTIAG